MRDLAFKYANLWTVLSILPLAYFIQYLCINENIVFTLQILLLCIQLFSIMLNLIYRCRF